MMNTPTIRTLATVVVAHALGLSAIFATLQAEADLATRPVIKAEPIIVKAQTQRVVQAERIEVVAKHLTTANLEQPTLALLRLPVTRA